MPRQSRQSNLIPPIARILPIQVESYRRLQDARAVVPDLPTMPELIALHGYGWLYNRANANTKYVTPFGCSVCGGYIHRVGNGSCQSCYMPIPAPQADGAEK